MKLKKLLINVLLIGGVTLSSCASYSTSDVEEIYKYILEKGLDNSNWEGVNYSYSSKSSSSSSNFSTKGSIKVTNYNDIYVGLLSSSTQFTYTFRGESIKETIKFDIYTESDNAVLRYEGKSSDNYKESFTIGYNRGVSKETLMSEANYYLSALLEIFEESFSWSYQKDSIKLKGSLRETNSGTKISYSASYKDTYDYILNSFYDDTYTDKVKYTLSLNYDENFNVSSYSFTINNSSKSSNSKEQTKMSMSCSSYNKKISKPSWAK